MLSPRCKTFPRSEVYKEEEGFGRDGRAPVFQLVLQSDEQRDKLDKFSANDISIFAHLSTSFRATRHQSWQQCGEGLWSAHRPPVTREGGHRGGPAARSPEPHIAHGPDPPRVMGAMTGGRSTGVGSAPRLASPPHRRFLTSL